MNKHWLFSVLLSICVILSLIGPAVAQAPLPEGGGVAGGPDDAQGAVLPPAYADTRGLYILYDDPDGLNMNPPDHPVTGGFWRYNWAELEPTKDGYNWAKVDNWITKEAADGKVVGIGFSIYNGYEGGADRGIQVPAWVWGLDAGARVRNTRRAGENWYLPDYWNPTLRGQYQDFITDFAQHVASTPAIKDKVAWISMGVGLHGETQPSFNGKQEAPDWLYYQSDMGKTQAQWEEYVRWCCDTYKNAFSSMGLSSLPIYCDIGPTYIGGAAERDNMSAYAASIGVGLRHNGLVMDHRAANYNPMREYWNQVPTSWETYQAYLTGKAETFWALMCGLSKRADHFTLDKLLWQTEEYWPLFRFVAQHVGKRAHETPSAWVALRSSDPNAPYNGGAGETNNYFFYLDQKDNVSGGMTQPVWNVGGGRGYKFDVPNGSYQVELHFAEVYYNTANARKFDIVVEGETKASNFDIWVVAGGRNKAYKVTYSATVTDGRLDVDFVPKTGNEPTIHAIKVTGPGYTARINCGGETYTDKAGDLWVADREYEAGSFGYVGGGRFYSGTVVTGTPDSPLYQTMRLVAWGPLAVGRYARKTMQASGNTRMYFDINNDYAYGINGPATITVTYCVSGTTSTDSWRLRYDAVGNADKIAAPVITKAENSKLWKQAVFNLPDARFSNNHPGNTDFSIDCMGDGDEYISFVEVKKGGSSPSGATLNGSVTLQGRPAAPHARWSVPLTVWVGANSYPVTTDTSGNFTLTGLTPGTYDIKVKNAHTLSNLRTGVTLNAGNNSVNMGELKEGDANNDDRVNSSDFLLLRGSYFKSAGQEGFVDGADFNEDDTVNSSDFLLLRGNYFVNGPVTLGAGGGVTASPAAASGSVDLSIDPAMTTATRGGMFDVDLLVNAGAAQVAAADVFVDFDPAKLELIEVVDGQQLESFAEQIDNSLGTLNLGVGTLQAPATGSFVLATLRFRVRADAGLGHTSIVFSEVAPRHTTIKDPGDNDLVNALNDGTVAIEEGYSVHLPIIRRQS